MHSQKITDKPNSGKLDYILRIIIFNLFLLPFLSLVRLGCVIPKDHRD